MASKTTGWLCTHAVTTANNSDPNKINVTVTCYWKNNGWNYDINNVSAWVYCGSQSYQVKNAGSIDSTSGNYVSVSCGSHTFVVNKSTSAQSLSCYAKITSASSYVSGTKTSAATSVSIPAKSSYKVTYNANGGSGAPSAQTKYHGTNLTLSSVVPTRSGYSFQGWGTSASTTTVSYKAGATYSANESKTLYAIWKAGAYTVTFNANGGNLGSVPTTVSKTHGVSLTLPTAKPTRTNYTFKGWGKSASATTVAYQAGGSYTTNAAITLYAIWEVAYTKPRITNVVIKRVSKNADGTAYVDDDSGTTLEVIFDWSTDETIKEIVISAKKQNESTWKTATVTNVTGTSGHSLYRITGISGVPFDPEFSYHIKITVSDQTDKSDVIHTLFGMKLPFDSKPPTSTDPDSKDSLPGVAVGKTAEKNGIFDIGLPAVFQKGWEAKQLDTNKELNDVKEPGYYASINGSLNTYGHKPPFTAGTFALEVVSSGTGGQLIQRATICDKAKPLAYERSYYGGAWGDWVQANQPVGPHVIWSGAFYMQHVSGSDPQEIKFIDVNKISLQNNGIVLVFSTYDNTNKKALDEDFNSHFVPKTLVAAMPGKNHIFPMYNAWFNKVGCKSIKIYDDKLEGTSFNTDANTNENRKFDYDNKNWVLRYVIGV